MSMKKLSIAGICVLIIGLILFGFVPLAIKSTKEFIANTITVPGMVVDMDVKRTKDSDGHWHTSEMPIVEYVDENKVVHRFRSNYTAATIDHGSSVTVRYLKGKNDSAEIDAFVNRWMSTIVLIVFGFIGVGTGVILLWFGIKGSLLESKAKKSYTQEIMAKIIGIEQNTSLIVNGRSPYRITAQWLNPESQQVHLFKSPNVWFDPTDFVKQKEVLVRTSPRNAKKYLMDISFLPKVA